VLDREDNETMTIDCLYSCLPWLAILLAAVFCCRVLIWAMQAKADWSQLRSVHRCESGSVQSLSFVLTLPFFVMMLMLIVQVTHIMWASVVVHYAAFAAVRSAVVWIPANAGVLETENRIGSFQVINVRGGDVQYRIWSGGMKSEKIAQAAVLATAPLGPSRNLGYQLSPAQSQTSAALATVYAGLDADSAANAMIPVRLRNKLAYGYQNTNVELTFWHRMNRFNHYQDPALQVHYEIGPDYDDFHRNEVGWQDDITATVTYQLPLLPGPVRLFSRAVRQNGSPQTDISGRVYVFPLSASATMINEGEKALLSYWQEESQ